MSRQLRGERDHVNRDYQEGYLGDFRDLRDRDFRDFHRDPIGDVRDERDSQVLREGTRSYRDDYPEEYDHRTTAASTSASLINNPGRLNGRATLHEGRNDVQLVNLCIPTRAAILKNISYTKDEHPTAASCRCVCIMRGHDMHYLRVMVYHGRRVRRRTLRTTREG